MTVKIQAAESQTFRTMFFLNSHNVEVCPSCRSLHPVHKPGFTEAGAYVLVWSNTHFQNTEMDIGGLSTLLLMHTLGAVILCETVLLRIMDVTEF